MMTTTGTYTFAPSLASLSAYALGRCGVRRTEITAEHLANVQMAGNLVLNEMANEQPRLWLINSATVTLTPGIATLTLPASCVMVTDVFVSTSLGGVTTDRIMTAVGRSDYAGYPNKATPGPPNVFWFNRTNTPQLVLWPVPDAVQTYTLTYYYFGYDQDAAVAGAVGLDLPNRFLMAFVDALSVELAIIYAPDRATALAGKAAISMKKANEQDREVVPLYISPMLNGYYN